MPVRARSVALGTFDGVHLGHQKLLQEAIRLTPMQGSSCVFTFDLPPEQYFKGEYRLLNSFEYKIQRLQKAGIEEVAWLPFNQQIASLPANEFVENFLVKQLQAQEIICGFDYRFGQNRAGDLAYLQQQGVELGFKVTVVAPVETENNEIISSTSIRSLLKQGDLAKAASYLGAFPSYLGQVVSGAGRGRSLGFPTANLHLDPRVILPPEGVYLTWCTNSEGLAMPAVTSIGKNPTFAGKVQTIETFILEFTGDLYGKNLEIQFLAQIRAIAHYQSASQLQDQIKLDVEKAKELLMGFRLQGQKIVLK